LDKDSGNRESALIWIIKNQVERRNLTPLQLSYYRGLHYKMDKKLVTNAAGKNQYSEVESQSGTQPRKQSTGDEGAGSLSRVPLMCNIFRH